MDNLVLNQKINIFAPFLNIWYVENHGAAFSIANNQRWLLVAISIIVLIAIIDNVLREKTFDKLNIIIYTLFISGIVGNLIDRIWHGAVIDYIAINLFGLQMPIFNLADALIVVGVGIYLIAILRGREVFFRWK